MTAYDVYKNPGEVEGRSGRLMPIGGFFYSHVRDLVPRANPLRYRRFDRVFDVAAAIKANRRFDAMLVNQFGVIYDGHHRLLAAMILGLWRVPCMRVMDPLAALEGNTAPDPALWADWNSGGSLTRSNA